MLFRTAANDRAYHLGPFPLETLRRDPSVIALDNRFSLQWPGEAAREYLIEYHYSDGADWLDGTIPVRGPLHDFGTIERRYWDTWIVPNGP